MAEQLPHPEQVQHASVVDDLDRTGADDAQMLHRLRALREDRRPGGKLLDLDRGGDPRKLVRRAANQTVDEPPETRRRRSRAG